MIKKIVDDNALVQANTKEMAILREHFPSCFLDDDSFDLERFKEYLSSELAVRNEGYELKFLGKNYARLLASVDTTTVVVPDREHNADPINKASKNVYISGDNLDALKQILKSYAYQVKCIYIDPPYNTGSDGFIYNDNFNFTTEELSNKLSIDEDQAKRILELTKRGSASHSAWLMFMYPRLLLARDLLSDDGAIFISIDDNECHNLKLLCDDVFGEQNFVSTIAWQSRTSIQNDTDFSLNHEYVLIYSRKRRAENRRLKESNFEAWHNDKSFVCQPIPLDKSKFSNPDNDPRGDWKTAPLDAPEERTNLSYGIENPITHEVFYPADGRHWFTDEDSYKELLKDNRIVFGQDGTSRPQLKVFYEEKKAYGSIDNTWFEGEASGTATSATKELQRLFDGKSYFDTPKPTSLVRRLLKLAIGDDSNAIVLDFFSGSGTTAEAVMLENIERQNASIRYICVQLPLDLTEGYEKMTADRKKKRKKVLDFLEQNNRPKTLDYIGIERIIRAAKKIKNDYPDATIDLGFKHYILQEPSENTLDKIEKFDPDEQGILLNNDILSDFGVETVLATWLIRDGYGFNENVEKIDFAGYTGYYIEKHLYLIDPDISESAIAAIINKYESDGKFNAENIVLFGYSFVWTVIEELKVNLSRIKDTEKNLHINFDIRY